VSRLDIHGCIEVVLAHFVAGTYGTNPDVRYSLHRQLQYRICAAWSRGEATGARLSERECVILAEAWLIAAPEYTKPIHESSMQPAKENERGE
jgi:hypothetical protein